VVQTGAVLAFFLWVTLAVKKLLLELVLMWLVVLAAGNPADAGLDVLHHQADRCIKSGGGGGDERTGIRSSPIPVLPRHAQSGTAAGLRIP
jgi:hypothetical protein